MQCKNKFVKNWNLETKKGKIESQCESKVLPTFYFVDKPCGSGNSNAILKYAVRLILEGKHVLYVASSIELLMNSASQVEMNVPNGVVVQIFNDKVQKGRVETRINSRLGNLPRNHGSFTAITSAGFSLSPIGLIADHIILIIDGPSCTSHSFQKIELNKSKMIQFIQCCTKYLDSKSRFTLNPKIPLEHDSHRREFLKRINKALFRRHASSIYTSIVLADDLRTAFKGETREIEILHFRNPEYFSKFEKVIFLDANFESTLVAKLWNERVNFRRIEPIDGLERFYNDEVRSTTKIQYFRNHTNIFTSKIFEELVDGGRIESPYEAAKRELNGRPAIFFGGEDPCCFDPKIYFSYPHGFSRGPNHYQQTDNLVCLRMHTMAANYMRFFSEFGIRPAEVRIALEEEAIYQAVKRSSLLDRFINADRTIIVPRLQDAHAFAKRLSGNVVISELARRIVADGSDKEMRCPMTEISDALPF